MKIHFIAIGGSIMHSLAIALKEAGHEVSGSDDQIYDPARSKLAVHGLLPAAEGWHPERIQDDLDVVILGMHAFADNPELLKAKELGLLMQSFPEFIFSQSEHCHRVVVAGSFGKTTITSMIMHVLEGVGKKFNYLVGATVDGFANSVRLDADAPVIILEGDEYLASKLDPRPKFLLYKPHITLITGIDWDHINVFPTEEVYIEQFSNLIKSLGKAGNLIYNQEDDRLTDRAEAFTNPDHHYLHPYQTPEYKVKDGRFHICLESQWQSLSIAGRHNMGNVAAAWEVCQLLSVPVEAFLEHIGYFKGAGMRMETLSEDDQKTIIRDYAHAPAKVRATVQAVRERFPDRNLIACFELHTFSSLNAAFLPHYEKSLAPADHAMVFVDPAAFEKRRMQALTAQEIQNGFAEEALQIHRTPNSLSDALKAAQTGNDVILLMSSGKFGGLMIDAL
ncbi:MAG: Mur ligase family protein [Bacteroidota bacterium]